ncbi:hypothetical protein NX774_12275 [Massilia agilis]|uniref:DUF2937 family protein n=1 Tax=Massilia agilis TaxID=1811226 RepID=A0ABT2DC09_9BURK|nr:hypothetical protein [Massilia agilis]MCS0808697.1 hypothetical protein [Massilia agilis]
MLMTLISLLGGGVMRLLPELIGLWNKATDNKHELAMMDKQLELQRFKGQDERETISLQGDIAEVGALLDAQKAALAGQMQLTGVRWADALNFLVRPATTYFFLLLFGLVKLATIVLAFQQTDAWHAILQSWDADDRATLSGILAFWFVGRVFDNRQRK